MVKALKSQNLEKEMFCSNKTDFFEKKNSVFVVENIILSKVLEKACELPMSLNKFPYKDLLVLVPVLFHCVRTQFCATLICFFFSMDVVLCKFW